MDTSVTRTIDVPLLLDISKPEMDFHETSFFRPVSSTSPAPQGPPLPAPALVREESQAQGRKTVKFEHLNLLVKFGHPSRVRLEEAQAIRAIGRLFPAKDVPRADQGQNFICMSLIKGPTLGERWPLLTQEEKKSICSQLSQSMASQANPVVLGFRRPVDLRVGSINRGPVQDIYFRAGHEAGPFHTVSAFNDWVQLPSCASMAAHYPEYWEYCKLTIVGPHNHEWREGGWGDSIVAPCEEEWIALSEYWMWRCP
ncbi:hypothetical protein C8A00DRAFT_40576 [Chaetomidium leptoderma]|uniref:Uncharacterized protein n=1 Tax=Chaetomidium leptoderma TaxID=669021 RepID=A0AAN6VUZ9_9PEZI|nr:hypothetical protein C8A00DRAFT_40576 [Chaetomidium leptoderma]